jgi:ribosome-associated translation inhibitor RaiA
MKVNIKFSAMESEDSLKLYAEEKIASFHKVLSEQVFQDAVCDVELRRDAHHQTGDVCYAEVTLEADGEVYRASKAEQTHEKALDKIKDDILETIRADKGRAETQFLRGAREAKEQGLNAE